MSTKAGKTPAELLHLTQPDDAWIGYCLSTAILTFGMWLENKLEQTEKRGKRTVQKYTLEKLIADPTAEATPINVSQFRPVSAAMIKKKQS